MSEAGTPYMTIEPKLGEDQEMTTKKCKESSYCWSWTLCNPTQSSDEIIQMFGGLVYGNEDVKKLQHPSWRWWHARIKYLVFQKEKSESGMIHYQGYVEFWKEVSFYSLKKNVCWEMYLAPSYSCRDSNRKYCMKGLTRVDGPYEYGKF